MRTRTRYRYRPAAALARATAMACAVATACGASPAGAVVGGAPVPAGTFGYVANVLIAGQPQCTGVLLAPAWVLTAGHCASVSGAASMGLAPSPVTIPASAYTVFLGTPDTDGTGGERHAVSQVVIDPDFLLTNGDGNDVTLLRLTVPSRQETMQVAPDVPPLWAAGVLATVAGFGTTSESSSAKPPTMRSARVPFITDAACARTYPFGAGIIADDGWFDPRTMVCAGYPQGGTDVCEGDSGGPILAPGPSGQLELIGTTSFGHGCAEPGYPTAYALAAAGPIRAFLERYVPAAMADRSAPARGSGTPAHRSTRRTGRRPPRRRWRSRSGRPRSSRG